MITLLTRPFVPRTREEARLMPRYAQQTRADRTRRCVDPGRHRDQRDVAMLQGQLRALERDIRHARAATAKPTRRVAGPVDGTPAPPPAGPSGDPVRLPCGAQIHIRPVEPADAPQLKSGFERLSALSRYKRFLGPLDHLTGHQLEYLTTVDHVDHEALVAVDAASGAGIGIARYVRDAHDPRLAEVAVVVTDAWQRCGVASVLLECLAERARRAGIEHFVGRSIVDDPAARALAVHAATPVARHRHGTTELTVRLNPRRRGEQLTSGLPVRSRTPDAERYRSGEAATTW